MRTELALSPLSPQPSNLNRLPRLRVDDFHFGMTGAELVFEPVARIFIAVAEQHGARVDAAREIEEVFAVRMGGEIEFVDLAPARDFAAGGAEEERFAGFG